MRKFQLSVIARREHAVAEGPDPLVPGTMDQVKVVLNAAGGKLKKADGFRVRL
ncbi:hypothetical protein ARZXY2_1275 [Arthrobacter sp. ZXY-2]|nr:hypothetical protein ARZXY2_1275 [Arthrobacter sp. ZXY-2]